MTDLAAALQPDDRSALRAALRDIRQATGTPVVFGGEVEAGTLRMSELLGARTKELHGLAVHSGAGLGGRVLAEGRPCVVNDYGAAEEITHDYDRPVLAEGIWSVAAVPVMVHGQPRAVMYAATRDQLPLGDRVKAALTRFGRSLGETLTVRHEVERKLAMTEALQTASRAEAEDPARLETVRAVHTELRAIAQCLPDDELRQRLHVACRRLTTLGSEQPTALAAPLTEREIDVLAQVALGATNAETARHLSLRVQTVKSYLHSAMRKLDARTRHEAVVRARSLRQLP